MNKPKRAYENAGTQNAQGRAEVTNFWLQHDDHLVPVKTVSLVLGVRLQKVSTLNIPRRKIDKLWYYRKGDVQALLDAQVNDPDSLLNRLREEHRLAQEKIDRQPSRRYLSRDIGGQPDAAAARQAKEKSKSNAHTPPIDSHEVLRVHKSYWISRVLKK